MTANKLSYMTANQCQSSSALHAMMRQSKEFNSDWSMSASCTCAIAEGNAHFLLSFALKMVCFGLCCDKLIISLVVYETKTGPSD